MPLILGGLCVVWQALAGKRTDHWLSLFTGSFLHKLLYTEQVVVKEAEAWGAYQFLQGLTRCQPASQP